MAVSQPQTNEATGKKAKLYPTIILCVLVGAIFCVHYSLTLITLLFLFFIIYIIYQLGKIFFRKENQKLWRLKKIGLWSVTFEIGFSVQYATRIAYETKGNEFIQAIEVYHEQNGDFHILKKLMKLVIL